MRVFPNKFPTVREDCTDAAEEPFYTQTAGRGRHEILVDTPDHDATIDTFDAAHIASILQVLQDRLHFFRNRADTQYVQIFKNCGPSAGMSMHHSHWQVVGLPVVPKRAATMAEAMRREDCLFCKMLAYEKETNRRIVAETEHFLALTKMLGRVMGIREDIGYNICVMDGPRDTDFHWHIEILPRIGGFAGFEFATDCYICMVSPENAAVYYRKEEAE